jgi:hypothetical protein
MARVELQQQVSLSGYYRDITIYYPDDWQGFKSGHDEDEYFSIGPMPRILALDEIDYAKAYIQQKRIRATISQTGAVLGPTDDPLYQWTHDQLDRLEAFLQYPNSRFARLGGSNNTLNRVCQIRERGYQYDGSELPALKLRVVNVEQSLPANAAFAFHIPADWEGIQIPIVIEDVNQAVAESGDVTWFSGKSVLLNPQESVADSLSSDWMIGQVATLKSSEVIAAQEEMQWELENFIPLPVNSADSTTSELLWIMEGSTSTEPNDAIATTETTTWTLESGRTISGNSSNSESSTPRWETETFIRLPRSAATPGTVAPDWELAAV